MRLETCLLPLPLPPLSLSVSTAIAEAQEGGDFVDKGDSETMSVIGTTILGIFSKYWIFLVGAMFLIVSLQESVDVFKIIYMVLFLLIINLFLVSETCTKYYLVDSHFKTHHVNGWESYWLLCLTKTFTVS